MDYAFAPPSTPENPANDYYAALSSTRKAETDRRHLSERRNNILQEVIAMEVKMGIETRWHPQCEEYRSTVKYISMRKYHRALDNLQRLVVQRLSELHKMNLSQTGKIILVMYTTKLSNNSTAYRVCTHIAKALQARCKAIRNAVQVYNRAASELSPPRPAVDWSTVTQYTFIQEFTLLADTRQDTRTKPWSRPEVREVIKLHRRIQQAHTEIERCNTQIRRVHTYTHDENVLFDSVLQELQENGDPIHDAVQEFTLFRRKVNSALRRSIQRIYDLVGFSGDASVGCRKGDLPRMPSTLR